MERIDELFQKIDKDVVEYYLSDKWGETLELQEEMKKLINEVLIIPNLNEEDYLILRRLLNVVSGIANSNPGGSWKRKHAKENGKEFKRILDSLPNVEEPKKEINSLDDWIKNLKIYRPAGQWNKLLNSELLNPREGFTIQEEYGTYTWMGNGLGSENDYYKSSYQVYSILREIVLNKKPPMYKRVYAEWVVNKIYDNLDALPDNIKLEDDYELSILIKLIHKNPEFTYLKMKNNSTGILDMDKLERCNTINNLKNLIKR